MSRIVKEKPIQVGSLNILSPVLVGRDPSPVPLV